MKIMFTLIVAAMTIRMFGIPALAAIGTLSLPDSHRPCSIMGRDCWRVLNRYTEYGWEGKLIGFDNPELNEHLALKDVVPCYVAAAEPPPAETGLAVWPDLADYFRKGAPDREILTENPRPDRPFFLARRSERNRSTWGSPVVLNLIAYNAWRMSHQNLAYDGSLSEWCNDLDGARRSLAGKRGVYGDNRPDNSNRVACLQAFLGDPPKSRYEQVDLLRRYYAMRKTRNFNGKMAVLDAHLNSLHLAADLGASLIRMETTSSGQYRYQPSAMFTRGAARQFGIPWGWYVAGYVNGPSKTRNEFLGDAMCRYPATPEATGEPQYGREIPFAESPTGKIRVGNGAPDFGISRSLFRRTHYFAYLSGANYIELEEWKSVLNIWDKKEGKTVFSPRGKIYAEFADFMAKHPGRGTHYSPVAICVPIAQGYPTWGGAPWNKPEFGYTKGDEAVDAVFFTLVPGCDYIKRLYQGDEMCLRNSSFANMYDVITPDASSQTSDQLLAVMKSYRALIVVGDYNDASWKKTLARYEAEGGKVVRIDDSFLADAVNAGEGRGAALGETHYPRVEAALKTLQREFFPFEVVGDCFYGLTASKDRSWLYVFNNDGVKKFADAFEELDRAKATDIKVSLRSGWGKLERVVELLSEREVAVSECGTFACRLMPGELAIFEIR